MDLTDKWIEFRVAWQDPLKGDYTYYDEEPYNVDFTQAQTFCTCFVVFITHPREQPNGLPLTMSALCQLEKDVPIGPIDPSPMLFPRAYMMMQDIETKDFYLYTYDVTNMQVAAIEPVSSTLETQPLFSQIGAANDSGMADASLFGVTKGFMATPMIAQFGGYTPISGLPPLIRHKYSFIPMSDWFTNPSSSDAALNISNLLLFGFPECGNQWFRAGEIFGPQSEDDAPFLKNVKLIYHKRLSRLIVIGKPVYEENISEELNQWVSYTFNLVEGTWHKAGILGTLNGVEDFTLNVDKARNRGIILLPGSYIPPQTAWPIRLMEVWILDLDSLHLFELPINVDKDTPPSLKDYGAFLDSENQKLYIYGGYKTGEFSYGEIPSEDLYVLDLIGRSWKKITPGISEQSPGPRSNPFLFFNSLTDTLWVSGGSDKDYLEFGDIFYGLNSDGTWQKEEIFKLSDEFSSKMDIPSGWSMISLPVKIKPCKFTATIGSKGIESDAWLSGSQVVIGIEDSPTEQAFSPSKILNSAPMYVSRLQPYSLQPYSKDIRSAGSRSEKWLLSVIVPSKIKDLYPDSHYPLLYWDPNEYCQEGTFRLWQSDNSGTLKSILVEDMRNTKNYQATNKDSNYFCIEWTAEDTVGTILPGVENVYRYDSEGKAYESITNLWDLKTGEAVWIQSDNEQSYALTGSPIAEYTLTTGSRWNMIGACTMLAQPSVTNAEIKEIIKYIPGVGYQRLMKPYYLESGAGFWILLEDIKGEAEIKLETVGVYGPSQYRFSGGDNIERDWTLAIKATGQSLPEVANTCKIYLGIASEAITVEYPPRAQPRHTVMMNLSGGLLEDYRKIMTTPHKWDLIVAVGDRADPKLDGFFPVLSWDSNDIGTAQSIQLLDKNKDILIDDMRLANKYQTKEADALYAMHDWKPFFPSYDIFYYTILFKPTTYTYFEDADKDGYGNDANFFIDTELQEGYVVEGSDCDDNDPNISPGSTELCNGRDDDCDEIIDEEGAEGCILYYKDEDGDRYGIEEDNKCLCKPDREKGYIAVRGDDPDNSNPEVPDIKDLCLFETEITATLPGLSVEESSVVIGIDIEAGEIEKPLSPPAPISLSPPEKEYFVFLKFVPLLRYIADYYKDVRAGGEETETWYIMTLGAKDIEGEYEIYYPLLTWDPVSFCKQGKFSLISLNEEGEFTNIVVPDMSMISNYQTTEEDGPFFCIKWLKKSEEPFTVPMNLPAGWSMISLPIKPENASVLSLFPESVVVYDYKKGEGYAEVPAEGHLEEGRGYWILLNEEKDCILSGQPILKYRHIVNEDGWAMIGGCTSDAKASSDKCSIDVIYGYIQGIGYQRIPESETLKPGKGYWILLNNVMHQAELMVETAGEDL